MTVRKISATVALSAALLTATAASAGAYGANMPKPWDSGQQVGKSTFANNPCQVTYRFGRTAAGYLYTSGNVGNSACRVSWGLFGQGKYSAALAPGVWLSGFVNSGWNATQSNVTHWDYQLPIPYNFGDQVYLKINTLIPYYGVSSGETHDVNNR